jgi:PAS domain S-box-containing protein
LTVVATDLFAGPGEMRALYREVDWSATPLGPVDTWSAALRNIVRASLDSPFPINLWCGPELVLVYNDGYRPVLGSKHPQAVGTPGRIVWAEIWPQIQPMFDQIKAGGPPIYADDAPFLVRRESDARDPREPNAWFTFALSPVRDENGDIIAFMNIVSETTSRILAERSLETALRQAERAEARLREVFAQAPAFLAVLRGEDHVFEYVNTAYYQLVGHRELLGKPVWEALPEVRGQGFEDLLNTVLQTGEPFIGREIKVTVARTPDSDPEERFVDLVYYPITDQDGRRTGVVAHGADVTEHVLARQEAQLLRVKAEEANQAKSAFLANMSHEIRTPINAVIGYADLLDAGIGGHLSGLQQDYVTRILGSSRHLLSLVNDILDLSKIEAGEMTVREEATSLRDPVEQAIDMVRPEAESKGLDLTLEWTCDKSVCVKADEARVRQIVLNLLSNAVKFTEQGGVHVRCGRRGSVATVAVHDTGIGISADQLESIFDPFVQAEDGHTRRIGGTGLGLTISRRFARMMGGDILVESRPGVGSTFVLALVGEPG